MTLRVVRTITTDGWVTFSKCRTWRYVLVRRWSIAPILGFLLLNPSTADEVKNDPTVERCCRRAHLLGYGGVCILNVYGYRSTLPALLWAAADPVGPDNDAQIILALRQHVAVLVCGWGAHAKHLRIKQIRRVLRTWDQPSKVMALAVNNDGSPGHPLYLPYTLRPSVYTP